ncbi:uncharacterized protein [Spinacia oleracea]|uniref:DUF4283 domain-containing protein n=1 Tax=Spinacia oleracea TaxID=3562 RepID=A0A9R0K803_SPIOL|nr:uncharacterized protein LOC110800966 [Spinacia oleracea]
MARKTSAKSQVNKHGNGTGKPRGPSSDSQALKTRSLDEVLGVEAINFGLENEVLTPKSSLKQLQVQSEVRHSFNEFMEVIHGSHSQARSGARSNVDVGMIFVPILQPFDDEIVVDNNFDEESVLAEDTIAPVQIELDDIQSEIDFWNSTVVCYIVGANPPINVMEGFVRRIWGSLKVDKVVLVKKGVYLVRFLSMESRDKVLKGHYFFDNKPLIVKPWDQDVDMEKEVVQVVPIWIQLKLNFKYWSEKAIFKLVSQLGKPIKRDYATTCRDKIQFARVMVEVPMAESLPDHIYFMNEHGEKIKTGKSRKVWVQKQKQGDAQPQQVVKPVIEVDQEGFQRALRPIRVRFDSVEPTHVTNPFDIMQNEGITENDDTMPGGEDEVRRFIQQFDIGLVGLLEHKVKGTNLGKLYQRVFTNWCFTGNVSFHKGGRIVVAWKPSSFTVSILAVTAQFIHCHVIPMSGKNGFYCTFVYAFNESRQRLELWRDLKSLNTQEPWIMCGDFNYVMTSEERIGAPVRQTEIADINECMHDCCMEDVKCVGNMFTWNNKQQGSARVFSKLDRVLANPVWQNVYKDAEVCFMSEGEFDHSPGLLTVYLRVASGRKPFRYFTMWKTAPTFNSIIQDVWSEQIIGSKMYVLVSKLKKIKSALKELNKTAFTDIQAADIKAHQVLIEA